MGQEVVDNFFAQLLLPMDGDSWVLAELTEPSELGCIHESLNNSMCEAYKRLVWKFKCCPWKWVELCRFAVGDPAMPIYFRRELPECGHCRDNFFTQPLAPHLLSDNLMTQKAAHQFVHDVFLHLRPSSLGVERQHLKISVKKAILSGKAGPFNAAMGSYSEVVRAQFDRAKARLEQNMFGSNTVRAARLLGFRERPTSLAVVRRGAAKATAKPRALAKKGTRASTAWNEFLKATRD